MKRRVVESPRVGDVVSVRTANRYTRGTVIGTLGPVYQLLIMSREGCMVATGQVEELVRTEPLEQVDENVVYGQPAAWRAEGQVNVRNNFRIRS